MEAIRVLQSLDKQMGAWELERLLGGPYDQGAAVLTIQVLIFHFTQSIESAIEMSIISIHDIITTLGCYECEAVENPKHGRACFGYG